MFVLNFILKDSRRLIDLRCSKFVYGFHNQDCRCRYFNKLSTRALERGNEESVRLVLRGSQ